MSRLVCACAMIFLMFASKASAQLVAGSPEDALFQQILAATDATEQVSLGTQFEEDFSDAPPKVLASVFTIVMNAYEQQQDHRQALAYGERIIALDPNNVNAYMALCRYLSVNLHENLDQAVEYGERAVSLAEGLSTQEAPPNYTPEQWQAYVAQTEEYARSILSYARTVR